MLYHWKKKKILKKKFKKKNLKKTAIRIQTNVKKVIPTT